MVAQAFSQRRALRHGTPEGERSRDRAERTALHRGLRTGVVETAQVREELAIPQAAPEQSTIKLMTPLRDNL